MSANMSKQLWLIFAVKNPPNIEHLKNIEVRKNMVVGMTIKKEAGCYFAQKTELPVPECLSEVDNENKL